MARWEPGTADRLRRAALELYLEQGYDATTIDEIAARAGVTERTYFRHFPDKREVLFDPDDTLLGGVVGALAAASDDASPRALIGAALGGVAAFFDEDRRGWARARHRALTATVALREREALKLQTMRTAMTVALVDRGLPDAAAAVVAGMTMAIFTAAFEQWVEPEQSLPLADMQDALLAEAEAVFAGAA